MPAFRCDLCGEIIGGYPAATMEGGDRIAPWKACFPCWDGSPGFIIADTKPLLGFIDLVEVLLQKE